MTTLGEYLELEDQLFAELKTEVYDEIEEEDKRALNRYNAGSKCDPEQWSPDWNRTWVAKVEAPTNPDFSSSMGCRIPLTA